MSLIFLILSLSLLLLQNLNNRVDASFLIRKCASIERLSIFKPTGATLKTQNGNEKSFLDEFKVDGEIVNPYAILKVSRSATKAEIKTAYRSLSRKYHPDAARFRKILPGSW